MLKVVLLTSALALTTTLAGCAQLLANASGSEPVGKTTAERTLSQRIEDMSIERTASINLYKTNPEIKNSHIVFMSFHSNVLIAGQALNALQNNKPKRFYAILVRSIKYITNWLLHLILARI